MGRPAFKADLKNSSLWQYRQGVIRHFDRAAHTYDAAAALQARVAANFAAYLKNAMPSPPRVLEFGCGTGQLTRLLKTQWPDAEISASDIAFNMVKSCTVHGAAHHFVMDAEAPCIAGNSFDIVCGSLAAQWFVDPAPALHALQKLVAKNGLLAFTTLAPGTLKEWHESLERAGVPWARHDYPESSLLLSARLPFMRSEMESCRTYTQNYAGGLSLLSSLRGIGADMRPYGLQPLSPGQLRRAITEFDRNGPHKATYRVIMLLWRRID